MTLSLNDKIFTILPDRVDKTITLIGTGATAKNNIFLVTGSVELVSIVGQKISGAMTNLTAGFLELTDGADITADGIVLSGLANGTTFAKTGLAAAALDLADNVGGKVTEAAAAGAIYSPCILTAKTAVATYVIFTYTTSDAPIVGTIKWVAEYKSINGGTLTAV